LIAIIRGITFVDVTNPEQGMAMVANSDADATSNTLTSARYMSAREYRYRLRVTSTVGSEPARIAFGVNRSQFELYSILDKALLSITPQEIDELTSHWRSEVVIEDSVLAAPSQRDYPGLWSGSVVAADHAGLGHLLA